MMRYFGPVAVALAASALGLSCVDDQLQEEDVQQAITSGPDLTESNVTLSTGTTFNTTLGGTFSGNDTVTNGGNTAAPSTVTRYWLSPDGVAKTGKKLGERTVGTIAIGGVDTGSAALTIPTGIDDGDYSVLACADANTATAELSEVNNCTQAMSGSTPFTVSVTSPDLLVSVLTIPATATTGGPFPIDETTRNDGGGATATTIVTRYWLSADGIQLTNFVGARSIAGLGAGVDSAVSLTETIPSSVAGGSYYLIACADATKLVAESDEANNCLRSTGRVIIGGPDLVENSVTLDRALVSTNGTLNVTDSVINIGNAASPASATKFFLSTDPTWEASDLWMIPGCTQIYPWADKRWGRPVAALAEGESETPQTTAAGMCHARKDGTGSVTLQQVPVGTYYLIACADGGGANSGVVDETNEVNNCTTSTTTFTVTTCGNGALDSGEQCDDGNLSNSDSCSDTCQFLGNQAPVIDSAAPTTGSTGVRYNYQATYTDFDGPGHQWNKVNNTCPGATIDQSGLYSFIPATAGTCVIGIQVCDLGSPNQCTQQTTTISIGVRSLHVSAISAVAADADPSYWNVTVTISVADQNNQPASGVLVSGIWNPTQTETGKTCTTDISGSCDVVTRRRAFAQSIASETWVLSHLKKTDYIEAFSANVASQITANNP